MVRNIATIEECANGYLLLRPDLVYGEEKIVCLRLEDAFAELLALFECRGYSGRENDFGIVVIYRDADQAREANVVTRESFVA